MPNVSDFTDWEKDFIIENPYPSIEDSTESGKSFSVVLKPKDTGVKKIEGFSLSYLDTSTGKIKQAKVPDMPLEVLKEQNATSSDLEVFKDEGLTGSNKNLSGIYGNYPAEIVLKRNGNYGKNLSIVIPALSVPPLLFLISLLFVFLKSLKNRIYYFRKKKADRVLKDALSVSSASGIDVLLNLKTAFTEWFVFSASADSASFDRFSEEYRALIGTMDNVIYSGKDCGEELLNEMKDRIFNIMQSGKNQ